MDYVSLDARTRKVRDNFYLMLSAIAPRPVTLISTVSKEGRGNLAPFGHINIGGANPPSVVFCAMTDRYDKLKDTARNILDTGEFVINVCTREFIGRVNECSRDLPSEENEAEVYGFTPVPSTVIKPTRIEESPLQMECKLVDTFKHGEGPLSSLYIVGEILVFHLREDVMTIDGTLDGRKFPYVGRLGMEYYCEITEDCIFEVERPM